MGIFLQTWFCRSCGLELCGRCHADLPEDPDPEDYLSCPKPHSKTRLFPVSSFFEAELEDVLQEMKPLTTLSPATDTSIAVQDDETGQSTTEADIQDALPVRRFKSGDLTDEQLDHLLGSGEPFVLTDVLEPGSPAELLDLSNAHPHLCNTTYFDGNVWCNKESTLEKYFDTWGSQSKKVRTSAVTGGRSLTMCQAPAQTNPSRGPLQIRVRY